MARIGLKSEPIALSPETVDKLLQRGSGDAALLYLYLLRTGGEYAPKAAQQALQWNAARVMSAFAHLTELGLAEDNTPPERKLAPQSGDCPDYTRDDITAELSAPESPFPALAAEVEHLLGRKLPTYEMKILLELYDHLAMPPEVLLELIAHQIQEVEAKYGPGRRPRMSEIKPVAYKWKKNGIDTLESADAYLKKQDYLRSREGMLLQAVGITGREAIEGERRFLHQWTEWGFGPEAVRLAYERTLLSKGEMRWPYCNGILRRWNEKGLHDPEAIARAETPERKRRQNAPGAAPAKSAPPSARQNAQWLQQFLAQDEEG
ncbi:MAG: DnaD domain protein [Oscillospiraceae bacterium]|nr:DnaD domain protein [Oscillospiraceae bacterium]